MLNRWRNCRRRTYSVPENKGAMTTSIETPGAVQISNRARTHSSRSLLIKRFLRRIRLDRHPYTMLFIILMAITIRIEFGNCDTGRTFLEPVLSKKYPLSPSIERNIPITLTTTTSTATTKAIKPTDKAPAASAEKEILSPADAAATTTATATAINTGSSSSINSRTTNTIRVQQCREGCLEKVSNQIFSF